jgi:hypothetical protein
MSISIDRTESTAASFLSGVEFQQENSEQEMKK